MSDPVEIRVPDIGDFADVPVIEVLVAVGDEVAVEDPLVTLESDKATMDVPSPAAGTVRELRIAVGDTVSEGTPIMLLDAVGAADEEPAEQVTEEAATGDGDGAREAVEVRVPDIGDFADVPIIEVLVKPGDEVVAEDPLITLESDKATMDVPAPSSGTVRDVRVAVGDTVSEGSVILMLEGAAAGNGRPAAPAAPAAPEEPAPPQAAPPAPPPSEIPEADHRAEVVVLGSGPGGYTAAFRAADLGLKTILIERYERLGGVCLNVGCIPSKALLHIARVIAEAEEAGGQGVSFGEPQIDLDGLRGWKDSVVDRLTGGLGGLARQRKVEVVQGVATLRRAQPADRRHAGRRDDDRRVRALHHRRRLERRAAARPARRPAHHRLHRRARARTTRPAACSSSAAGSSASRWRPSTTRSGRRSRSSSCSTSSSRAATATSCARCSGASRSATRRIHLETKVTSIEAADDGLRVTFEGDKAPEPQTFDRVLLAIGRRPNGASIGAEKAGVEVDERGFIHVDQAMRTNVPHIYAIGDIVGEPMLAHKATHEGKVAAENAAGHSATFDPRSIPSVAYTDPEVAWTGLTETEAKAQGIEVEKASFPWAASGRALSLGRDEGVTKLLVDPESKRVLGAGMVGPNAGELLAEAVHAIEMSADTEDIALTIHPHPTLSETIGFAAEIAEGTITDLYVRR